MKNKMMWGDKVISNDSLNRINTRRLLLHIQRYVRDTLESIEELDSKDDIIPFIENALNPFLESIKSSKGINNFKIIKEDLKLSLELEMPSSQKEIQLELTLNEI